MKYLKYISIIWRFPFDLVSHLVNESHRSHTTVYIFIRKIYVLSRGRSRLLFRSFFRFIRRVPGKQLSKHIELVSELKENGVIIVPDFLPSSEVEKIRNFLADETGFTLEKNTIKTPAKIDSLQRGVRLQYEPDTILSSPYIHTLIQDPFFKEMAASYLGCTPVFAGVNAWWSLADSLATKEDLNWSAQQYHFDYDYPMFVKFFIYLTDVGIENGPFTFVQGTHDKKCEWRDGRLEDSYIEKTYPGHVKRLYGSAGDLIIADTAGYHKGERVTGEPRLMLQIEFAVSRLGGSSLYDCLPRALKPKGFPGHTFDLFSK